ncbi:MAG: hypothetical protein IJL66_05815 [Lachnospiraceae bacterium]|nr:hypothetical protein [Lachnospiraceae bacterium]
MGAPGISFAINLEEAEAKSLIDRLGKAGETKALPQETVVRASPAFVHCLGEDPSAAPLAVLYLYVSDGAYGLCDMETRTCYRIDRETAETVRRIMASRKEAWGAGWEEMWP